MKRHFVVFVSPGSFVSETSEKKISSCDVDEAVRMSKDIVERHGAKPFGFYFKSEGGFAKTETKTSHMYYLGGKVETLEEVEARNLPEESILRSNMRNNDIQRILVNCNSYKSTMPLNEGDVVLDMSKYA